MLDQDKKRTLEAFFQADQVLINPAQTAAYQLDAGMERHIPDGVVLPEGTDQVSLLARWASQHNVTLTARGAGTSYTGGSITLQSGIVVSFARMKKILAVNELSQQVVVQPGVVNNILQQHLLPHNLVYPPDPASYTVCTIGGNIAENAGGPHCLKYGVTNNYVLGLEAVLADGQIATFGGPVLDPPEYDFTSLLTGSEGTLALVTAATLKLRHPFQGVQALTASFSSVSQAGEAVSSVIAAGLMPATIELMDNGMINIVEDYIQAGFPRQAGAMLIIDVDGYPDSLQIQLTQIADILERYQPLEIKTSRTAQERDLLWRGRRSAAGAISRISPNELMVDVSVPRSRMAETIQAINQIGQKYSFRVCYLAHAGDGNLHPNLLCDFSKPGERERALLAAGEILRFCAGIGGSISGEHGIGLEKRDYLSTMYAPAEIEAMLEIKEVFDPANLLNPGKIFPPEHQSAVAASTGNSLLPGNYFEPSSAVEAADGLRSLQEDRIPTYIAGGQTRWQGDPPGGTLLSTTGISGIEKLSLEDLYVTARGGTPLAELQAALSERGFWIPTAIARPESTLGGALAANGNGPLRALYGGLRDQLLATQVVLADGRILRFGRPLVKDVAGYNVSKMLVGSYGTLGLITEATLKLYPLPRARCSLVFSVPDLHQGLTWGLEALRQAITCSGIVLVAGQTGEHRFPNCRLVYTAEGHPQDVAAEMRIIAQRLVQCGAQAPVESDETSATQQWERLYAASDFVIRAAVPPSDLEKMLSSLNSCDQPYVIDITNGMLAFSAAPGNIDELLSQVRLTAEPEGYAIMAAGERSLLGQIDPWGKPRPAYKLMRDLKLRWDPGDILNRGEFISPFFPHNRP
jgi:D-lactate dehydrogenase (cytochrome)